MAQPHAGFLHERLARARGWEALKVYHRKRQGFGLQFCAQCLREGPEPYFRKSWRVAFNTVCVQHQCMLRDRCPNCGAGVAFHRRDMKQCDVVVTDSLAGCHQCGFDLGEASAQPIISYDKQASDWHAGLCRELECKGFGPSGVGLDTFAVMRKVAMLLTSQYAIVKLQANVCDQLRIKQPEVIKGRIAMETRPLDERHHLIQLVAWLMVDLAPRLEMAWRAKAIRYNHLGKDFEGAPEWYLAVIESFMDWRRK